MCRYIYKNIYIKKTSHTQIHPPNHPRIYQLTNTYIYANARTNKYIHTQAPTQTQPTAH